MYAKMVKRPEIVFFGSLKQLKKCHKKQSVKRKKSSK